MLGGVGAEPTVLAKPDVEHEMSLAGRLQDRLLTTMAGGLEVWLREAERP